MFCFIYYICLKAGRNYADPLFTIQINTQIPLQDFTLLRSTVNVLCPVPLQKLSKPTNTLVALMCKISLDDGRGRRVVEHVRAQDNLLT